MTTARLAAYLAALLLTSAVHASSAEPPPGPPWVRTIEEATELALERQVPIFAYFTKTY